MKKVAIILVTVFSAVLLVGCLPKTIVVPQTAPVEEHGDGNFDISRLHEFCKERLDAETYPLGSRIDIQPDGDHGIVRLVWALKDDATEKDACKYGEAFIRAFNDAIAEQDPTFRASTERSYGEFFEIFDAEVIIFRESDQEDTSKYLVNQIVEAGTDEALKPFGE